MLTVLQIFYMTTIIIFNYNTTSLFKYIKTSKLKINDKIEYFTIITITDILINIGSIWLATIIFKL